MQNTDTAAVQQMQAPAKRTVRLAIAALALLCCCCTLALAATPPQVHVLTEQEAVDMMVGSSILCSRGGDTQGMIDRVRKGMQQGMVYRMISLESVPDDWTGFSTFGVGGGEAWPDVVARYKTGFTLDPKTPTPEQVLSEYVGKKFDVTFGGEGGGVTAGVLITAGRLNIPFIDGGSVGRCIPEVGMSPMALNHGLSPAPLAGVSRYGDEIVIAKTYDVYRVEDMTRSLGIASGGGISLAGNALSGKQLKEALIPGWLSQCILLGKAAREAVAAGKDPVEAVVRAGHGYLLFTGTVTRSDTVAQGGFGRTEAYLKGTGKFEGSEYRIFNKNENMLAWKDGKLDASAPDVIADIDPKTGWAMRGGKVLGGFVVGEELAIVGFPNYAPLRTPQVIAGWGPEHFGFKEQYVPIEVLHGASGK